MSTKTIQVEVQQGLGFKTECRAGKHVVLIDQSAAAGGTDAGPTPLDYQLMALGGCIAAIGRLIANQRRLALRGLTVSLTGELDTDRLLGKSTAPRAGFSRIVAQVRMDADLSRADQESFLRDIEARCPVSDNLQQVTPVRVTLAS